MLRPRDDDDQKVLQSELEITPEPTRLAWTRDIFGNHVATARFAERASKLCFKSTVCVDHAPAGFGAADIEHFARTHPFAFAVEDGPYLAPFIAPSAPSLELDRWVTRFLRQDGSTDTREVLVSMTQTIRRTFKHIARHEKGTQDPIRTLQLGGGSCRDLAMLMIAALRALGIAARFVSGYLHLADNDDSFSGGNTHAWVQVYVPGPGWIDFDPSSGMVGNRDLVRVAVVREPREAIPLQGTWIGTKSDHLAMKVAVNVVAVADTEAGRSKHIGMRTLTPA